jgi:hypothetical protein
MNAKPGKKQEFQSAEFIEDSDEEASQAAKPDGLSLPYIQNMKRSLLVAETGLGKLT